MWVLSVNSNVLAFVSEPSLVLTHHAPPVFSAVEKQAEHIAGKMNPNAAQFSPSNLAVMPYTGAVKANGAENRPQDLIMHESIRQLVQDVQELKSRADGLELENAYLKKTNVQLKQRVELLEQSATKPTTAPAVQSNICGYEPSEASSTGMPPSSGLFIVVDQY